MSALDRGSLHTLNPAQLGSAVSRWLDRDFPASLAGRSRLAFLDGPPEEAGHKEWIARVGITGLGVPRWPLCYGGAGLDAAQAAAVAAAFAAAGAWNPITGSGPMNLGPTLMEYGSDAQKAEHLPPIARGERVWCQGYSEPGAGSDLASLSTAAVRDGDDYVVNGQKIWTSHALHADWCFCLVRTDKRSKQGGISLLLIDLRSPGVEVRPIELISGTSAFCELFLSDVRVPDDQLVGAEGAGWAIAKTLLRHERVGMSRGDGGRERPRIEDLRRAVVAAVGTGPGGRLNDDDLRSRLAAHDLRAVSYDRMLRRFAELSAAGEGHPAFSSVAKNAGSQLMIAHGELLVEALGAAGLGWAGDDYSEAELRSQRDMLRSRGSNIAGGTYEIQLGIIAQRLLELPKTAAPVQ